jgi:hypothetical protein
LLRRLMLPFRKRTIGSDVACAPLASLNAPRRNPFTRPAGAGARRIAASGAGAGPNAVPASAT